MMVGVGEKRSKEPTRRPIATGKTIAIGMTVAVVVIALLAGLAAIAIAYRQSIAETLLMRQLRNLGLDRVEFAIHRFDAGVLELGGLRIGNGDGLAVEQIKAQFSLRGLFASRLDALQISGVRLRGTLDEAGLSFGSLDPLFEESPASADPGGPTALPTAGIEIRDAELELTTADGPLRASLELRAFEIAPGRLEVDAEIQVDHALVDLGVRLSATGSSNSLAGELSLEANAAGAFGPTTSASAISLTAKTAFTFEEGDIAIQPEGCAEIQIEGLAVESVLTLAKPLVLCLRSRSESGIRISKEGAIETDLELAPADFAADLQIGGEPQRVSGELPRFRLRTSSRGDQFDASLEAEAGRLEFAQLGIGVRKIALEASLSHPATFPKGQLRIGEIFDSQTKARFPNLAMNARFEPRDDGIDFKAELTNPNRDLVVDIDGTQRLSDATGRADLHLHAIDFDPDQLQPSALFPVLADLLTDASGSIEVKGAVEWNADGTRGTVEVAVGDLSATSTMATVEHLNAIIELNETGATLPDQILSVGRLDFGLELTDGVIRYKLEPGGSVSIKETSWKFAGGELTTAGEFDLRSENQQTSLLVKNVDLTELIELVDLEGLSGSGTLEGELPIILADGEIEIRGGVLRSSGEAGVIQYRPDSGTANIGAANDQFATAMTVLKNFHYERLEIEINGSVKESVVIQIHFAGVNPDYQSGHPIEFNLSVDARLSDLLRTGMRVYRIPQKIEERLRTFAEKLP
jgi:hypothetical protein